ncbi:MAG: tRNA (cytidine(34)-2'-O)-methyltransferase [Alphaproteobacteria bacterium]|nr:tRNA (cytidine(34)-2'-O)-methyltransferase [Alphaproteobacteria bacterium]
MTSPNPTLSIALYQPDMPQNCGAIMRLCACFGVPLDLIEPFGFIWDEARVRRVAMDYINHVAFTRHTSWDQFKATKNKGRLILLSTKAATPYDQFRFAPGDCLLLGRESAGVPEEIHAQADARVVIPLQNGMRSLNVGMSAAIVLSEALRQLKAP